MRKLIVVFIFLLSSHFCHAQNVGIGTTTPDANAALDIVDSSRGLLIPRMDSVSRKNIPATNGMVVYDTDTKCCWYNDGERWVNVSPKGNLNGDMLYWNGASWVLLPAGSNGQYLRLSSSGAPEWTGTNSGSTGANISTQNISNPAPTSIQTGGTILSDGGAAITARGVVWDTLPGATTALTTKTNDGTGVGSFVSNPAGLLPAKTYYLRAYCINSNGISYGNEITFSTISSFTIGQNYGGGKIFYIDGTGQHGLIVSPEDLSTGIGWDINAEQITNATGLAIGTGKANTDSIIARHGFGSYAATLCRDFYNGGGFTDWFLPSFYELNQVFLKRNELGIIVPSFTDYWSSSETGRYTVLTIDFSESGPNQLNSSKSNTYSVRAVRKF